MLINHARHLQHLLRVGKVSMQVADRHYRPLELARYAFRVHRLGRVGVGRRSGAVLGSELDGLDRPLGGVGVVMGVMRIRVVGVHCERPREWEARHEIEGGEEGPADPEYREDRDEDGEQYKYAGHFAKLSELHTLQPLVRGVQS